ncbi:alpha/beta fold hydrolase [Spirillospora sp. NPDC047279]|uniref:alpha/beta fold hydrolase n=1 Tax=Spirillospora sp. NPDC047279 TaxID=3155478 RepID=UPI0033EA96BA
MKRLVVVAAAVAVVVSGTVAAGSPAERADARAGAPAAGPGIAWRDCPGLMTGRAECAQIEVPLDHRKPHGKKIHVGISIYRATDRANYKGVLLTNPGGVSASGLLNSMAMHNWLAGRGFPELAAQYDMIGMDPRGVETLDFNPIAEEPGPPIEGDTDPVLSCDKGHKKPPLPDYTPSSAAEERAWIARSKKYADDCAKKYGWLLPHMGTVDHAHDIDVVRRALGVEKINYYGFSHATHLGAAYATLFPNRIDRMIWDGVSDPRTLGYKAMLEQSRLIERNIGFWYEWAAKWDSVYRLGKTRREVEATYWRVRDQLKKQPIQGRYGPDELDDYVLNTGMSTTVWVENTQALADWVHKQDATWLLDNMHPGADDSPFAVRNAADAVDTRWPRDWKTWHDDAVRMHEKGYRSITWSNVWHHAPIAFWPVRGGSSPLELKDRGLPGFLLIHGSLDGVFPVEGAFAMHRRFPSSRLLLEVGGKSHANSLNGNKCVDGVVAAYLGDGTLPGNRPGADAGCEADPAINDPDPNATEPETTRATSAARTPR